MARRTGLQTELLVSLALLMLAATGIVAGVVRASGEARLRAAVGRALEVEARSPDAPARTLHLGTSWWRVGADGTARPWGPGAEPIDASSRELAGEAAARRAGVLRPGGAGGPVRFATPLDDGSVAVARLPVEASRGLRGVPGLVLAGLLTLDALVFTAFGVWMLRRRVLLPLRRVGEAARALAEGDLRVRVPVDGVRETAELAAVFNEMGDALASRTEALEKAVADLRGANRELAETREGLDRAQRLASVGSLAAGVAHEVGNPIGAMLAFVDLARRDPGLSEVSREQLRRAGEQGTRVRTILRQLLDFSRPAQGRIGPLDLAAVAEEAAALVRPQQRYAGVEIAVEREGAPPRALGDPGVVGQVLVNLLLNASDAVGGRERPRVRVTVRATARRHRASDPPGLAPERARPDAVECVVADNGPGVAPADRERIFDPFFTTKDPGEGTGLGLANAQRLLESLGGTLALESPGALGGASFRIVLPAAPAGDAQAVRGGP